MQLTEVQVVVLVVLVPIAVYGLARLIFTAFFRAKAEYLRRFFNDGTGEKK